MRHQQREHIATVLQVADHGAAPAAGAAPEVAAVGKSALVSAIDPTASTDTASATSALSFIRKP